MKRFLCKGLILALLCAMCLPAALAEDVPEAVSEAVEAEVAEATETGDTGLTVEGAPAPVEEAPAPEAETAQDAPMAAVTDEVPADEGEQAVAAPEVAAATGIQLSAAAVNLGVKEKLTLGDFKWNKDGVKWTFAGESGGISLLSADTENWKMVGRASNSISLLSDSDILIANTPASDTAVSSRNTADKIRRPMVRMGRFLSKGSPCVTAE